MLNRSMVSCDKGNLYIVGQPYTSGGVNVTKSIMARRDMATIDMSFNNVTCYDMLWRDVVMFTMRHDGMLEVTMPRYGTVYIDVLNRIMVKDGMIGIGTHPEFWDVTFHSMPRYGRLGVVMRLYDVPSYATLWYDMVVIDMT